MLTLLHLVDDESRLNQDRGMLSLKLPSGDIQEKKDTCRRLLAEPRIYKAVARLDGSAWDVGHFWALTQNGGASTSWSRFPPGGIQVIGKGFTVVRGVEYGWRSSMDGDVVVVDGKQFFLLAGLEGAVEVPEVQACRAIQELGSTLVRPGFQAPLVS